MSSPVIKAAAFVHLHMRSDFIARRMTSPILTMDEAAGHLRVSRRWLQDHLKTIPSCHLRAGKRKLFDAIAIDAIRE